MNDAAQFAIQSSHRVAITVLSVVLFALVIELVRREYLKERYALLWLASSAMGLIIGIFPGLIARIADVVHFQLITTLFVVSFLYVLGIILSFTVIISKLAERNRRLAQDVALLAHRVERIEENRSGI
jgi:hypothetical protein